MKNNGGGCLRLPQWTLRHWPLTHFSSVHPSVLPVVETSMNPRGTSNFQAERSKVTVSDISNMRHLVVDTCLADQLERPSGQWDITQGGSYIVVANTAADLLVIVSTSMSL